MGIQRRRRRRTAPAKTPEEMRRVIFNDYVDATLAALFVAVYGLMAIRRALGSPQVTALEVGAPLSVAAGASHA